MDSPHPKTGPSHGGQGEAGFIALEWVLAIAVLIIPVVLLAAGASRWPERQQGARAAAAEGARAAVLAQTHHDAITAGHAIATQVATNHGIPSEHVAITVDAPIWEWGATVTVTVTVEMPTLEVPGIGTWHAISWSTTSAQRIEDHRSLQ